MSDCNTRLAQGGIAAAIGPGDSPAVHFRDTVRAGAGLCDEVAVRILTEEAAERIADLVQLGVDFDTIEGQIALTLEAAHTWPRILHAGGDTTGARIEEALSARARNSSIELEEEALVTDLIVHRNTVTGIKIFDKKSHTEKEFAGQFVILASGGAGQIYSLTTNPAVATGDGVALAFNAGARVGDIEFFQFHPTALCLQGVSPFLISEAARGEGGLLVNACGERFMPAYAREAELAPRDVVARAIANEMAKTGADKVYLDIRHLTEQRIAARFPQIYRFCSENGLDISRELIPVSPAAHYMIGGVIVNYRGETNIKNLFVAGEAACTGVHGANRLASNSLMEVLVFGRRIIDSTIGKAGPREPKPSRVEDLYGLTAGREVSSGEKVPSLEQLQNLMWQKAGIIRNQGDLRDARDELAGWSRALDQNHDRKSCEMRNLVLVSRMLVEAAFIRKESRGAHFCTDYPEPEEEWRKHIVFKKEQGID